MLPASNLWMRPVTVHLQTTLLALQQSAHSVHNSLSFTYAWCAQQDAATACRFQQCQQILGA